MDIHPRGKGWAFSLHLAPTDGTPRIEKLTRYTGPIISLCLPVLDTGTRQPRWVWCCDEINSGTQHHGLFCMTPRWIPDRHVRVTRYIRLVCLPKNTPGTLTPYRKYFFIVSLHGEREDWKMCPFSLNYVIIARRGKAFEIQAVLETRHASGASESEFDKCLGCVLPVVWICPLPEKQYSCWARAEYCV